ncbi:hypothetical protein F5Y06DRAFT_119736 [Hypoxylon sp. FL0890]|nr:hypothetical protein F5Y06DRAFT_119736 [Hypoxylon sp. FL0890]
MASDKLARSTLNPAAPCWYPGHRTDDNPSPEPITIPNGFIAVDAAVLGWRKAVHKPLEETDIASATKGLLAGMDTRDRIFQIQELRQIYADYAKNPWRRYDLSTPLEQVFLSRWFSYCRLFGHVGDVPPLRSCDMVDLIYYVHRLNDLVKRILCAEYTGVFTQSSHSQSQELLPQGPATLLGTLFFGSDSDLNFDAKIFSFEAHVSQLLSELKSSETENDNHRPGSFAC